MEGCYCSPASSCLSFSTSFGLSWSRGNPSAFTSIYGRNKLKEGELFVPQILFRKSKKRKWIARRHVLANHFEFGNRKNESQLRNGTEAKMTSGILTECVSSFCKFLKKSSIKFHCWWKFSLSINSNTSEWTSHSHKFFWLQRWQKKIKRQHFAFLVGSTVAFLFIMSTSVNIGKNSSWALTEENLLFLEAWRIIDRAYIDKTFNGQSWFRYREAALRHEPMNTHEETYAAIRKMLATLDDPFTRFLEPEKFKNLKSGTEGAVVGVGLEIGFDIVHNGASANLLVVSPVPGGPADRAGIMPGDLILAIDGTSTQGMGLYDAAERLQGPEDSVVELTLHEGDSQSRKVSLKREKITLNPVSWRLCEISRVGKDPLKIGYIKLTNFNQNASRAVKEALETLRENKVASYVLDLRNNSGGLFPEGIEIAKIWLDKSVIVYICDSKGVRDIYETDGSEAIATSEPLVVLVNKGTASASEILAAALKDNKRAIILGEPTFGKGKIQSVFELSDGSGLIVTVARYETPAHTDIDKVGVFPDQPLPAALPMDGNDVCKCLQEPNSTCFWNPKLDLASSPHTMAAWKPNGTHDGLGHSFCPDSYQCPVPTGLEDDTKKFCTNSIKGKTKAKVSIIQKKTKSN